MIYKGMGELVGMRFYDDLSFGFILLFLMVLPQIILFFVMRRNMVEIPQELIDIGLYQAEDPEDVKISKNMTLPLIIGITLISVIGGVLYAKRFAKKWIQSPNYLT